VPLSLTVTVTAALTLTPARMAAEAVQPEVSAGYHPYAELRDALGHSPLRVCRYDGAHHGALGLGLGLLLGLGLGLGLG